MLGLAARTVIAVAILASTATAQIAPIFHGVLDVRPAAGTLDRHTGDGTLKIHRWRFLPAPTSNGIFPGEEDLLVAVGDNNFFLPAGSLLTIGGGRMFRYRAPRDAPSGGIRSFRLSRRSGGAWVMAFTLTGLAVPRLLTENPICVPSAVIIGDDDAFSGAKLTSPTFRSRRLAVASRCDASGWPWLGR